MLPPFSLRLSGLASVLGVCAALAGCDGERAEPPVTRRDSAGVEIVHNHTPAWSDEERWRLDGPTLRIGSADDVDGTALYRVQHAMRLEDDRILIENGGTSEIRLYDTDGTLSWSFGGEGDGPGEFRSLGGAPVTGPDSILAYDRQSSRVSVISLSGALAGSFQLEPTGHPVWELDHYRLAGRSERGELVLTGWAFDSPPKPDPTLYWDSVPNMRYAMDGSRVGTIGIASGMLMYGDPTVGTTPEFFRSTHSGLSGDRFIIGDADDYTFNQYRGDGTLERQVRKTHDPRPVASEDVERVVRMTADRISDEGFRRRYLESKLSMLHPDRMPAYSDLIVSRDSHVWIRPYRAPWEQGDDIDWDVFDPDGRWLGAVTVSQRLRVMEIGPDHLLGIARDELGIETLHLYSVVKPPSGS